MSKKELQEKIAKRQKMERIRRRLHWYHGQIHELDSYIQFGDLDWLRERAWHAIHHLAREAKAYAKKNGTMFDFGYAWVA